MAAVPAAMLTRDPAALYREGTERQKGIDFGAGDREGESEKLLPRLFVTKKRLKTVTVKLGGGRRTIQ